MIVRSPSNKFIHTPADVFEICRNILKLEDEVDQDKEHLWVFHLNARSKIKLIELAVLGTMNRVLFTPRDVFRRAITNGTASIILAHNHPSGDPCLSQADIAATKKLIKAGDILQIEVSDHVVVGESDYSSYQMSGLNTI